MTSMQTFQLLRPLPSPPPLSIHVQNSSTSLTLGVQYQINPPLQMITSQLKVNIIQG